MAVVPARLRRALAELLTAAAAEVKLSLDEERAFADQIPPEDPHLAATWDRLQTVRRDMRLGAEPVSRPFFSSGICPYDPG